MQAVIAQHLNIAESLISAIEEWAHVLFVRFTSGRPRFVSKKVIPMTATKQTVTRSEMAEIIADAINDSDSIFQASTWDKKVGEVRVYVSYPSKKGKKDCGYVRIIDSGVHRHLTLQAGTIEGIYSDAIANLEIVQPTATLKSNDALTQVVEECWECGATYTTYGNVEAGNMCCRRCR